MHDGYEYSTWWINFNFVIVKKIISYIHGPSMREMTKDRTIRYLFDEFRAH